MAQSCAYQGVILAAGHGSRMGPFGESTPKPIAPICNKPLMAYQLEHMRALGIEEVIVVIGHLGHRIIQTIGDGSKYGVSIRYVEQMKRLGLAHAVGQLNEHIDHPFLLFLGDIFFEVNGLERMVETLETHGIAAVVAVKDEADPEAIRRNFAMVMNPDGTVKRLIEKPPRQLPNRMKGCGLYLFDPRIFEAIRRTPRTALRDEYELTDAIQLLAEWDYGVRTAEVVTWDMNITFVHDLALCCRHQLTRLGLNHLVGERCHLADGVELHETVIGDDVVISRPARLEGCVVLSGSRLDESGTFHDRVILPQAAPEPA
jgi:NDP-sugar pyrophosphorylase family protein